MGKDNSEWFILEMNGFESTEEAQKTLSDMFNSVDWDIVENKDRSVAALPLTDHGTEVIKSLLLGEEDGEECIEEEIDDNE